MKKAQLKIMENIGILIIFFFILIIGLVIYSVFFVTSAKEEKQNILDLQGISISQVITSMPELQCSLNNVIRDNCIDYYKAAAFAELSNTSDFRIDYYFLLRHSTITLETVTPFLPRIVIYNNSLEDTSVRYYQVPVLFYNSASGQARGYGFGYLEIKFYAE